jgi:hypothetical protein
MKNREIYCLIGIMAGTIMGMTTDATIACVPSFCVIFNGHAEDWCHVDCPREVSAQVYNGVPYSWWFTPSADYSCYGSEYCGNPAGNVTFASTGTYTVKVEVFDPDYKYACDTKTVHIVAVGLTPDRTTIAADGPRARVTLSVTPAGPTGQCRVRLALTGTSCFAKLYDASTGGNLLLQGNQSHTWTVDEGPDHYPNPVWVQGINGSPLGGTLLTIHYVDPYGVTHPTACAQVQIPFKIYEVHFGPVSAGNNPDLPAGRICVNAQPQYKKAKYRVTQVLPDGSARVTVAPGSSVTDITFEGINGANVNALVSGDEFWAIGNEQYGDYALKLVHNSCSDAQEIKGDSAFKFCIYRGDTIPWLEAKIASWGTYETWDYKDGHYVNYSQSHQASNVKNVYIFTEGGDYEGNVKVSARAVATGTVEGEIQRVDAFGDIAGSISVSMGAFTATLIVPGQQDGAAAGGGVVLQVGALPPDPADTLTGQTEVQRFGSGTYKRLLPEDVAAEWPWTRTFSLPNGPHLVIGIGAAAGASGNPAYRCKGRARTSNVQVNVLGGTYEIVP